MWYNDSIGGHDRHIRAKLLRMRQASPESVRCATDRADEKVRFTDEALMTVQAMPCVFLPLVLKECMDRAREKKKIRRTSHEEYDRPYSAEDPLLRNAGKAFY
jgi:hypothetical protein